jgi:hypothetical protein
MFLLAICRHFAKSTTSIELVDRVHCLLHCVSADEELVLTAAGIILVSKAYIQ